MRLGIDIDGVLANFQRPFIDLIEKTTGRYLFPARDESNLHWFDIPCWDYPQHFGYTNKELSVVWALIEADRKFWFNLIPYQSALDAFKYLAQRYAAGDDLYFITSRPGATAKKQTESWLIQKFFCIGAPTVPTVLISSEKGWCARALKLDAYIDDRWENCTSIPGNIPTFLLDQPWNRQYDASKFDITRVQTLVGIAEMADAQFQHPSKGQVRPAA